MLNPFFLNGSKTEQGLLQDLINESLRMYGVDVYYIPRQYITEKTIIREVIESEFNNAYPIEAYINSYDGYEGQGTLLSKFGIQELDDLSIVISKERFELHITPLIKNLPNVKLSSRPKEGDLIYFPLGDRLFEITYVEHEKPFYQLRENYVYEIKCQLFRYGDEVLNTGIEYIDDNVEQEGYIQTLTMFENSSPAFANSFSVNGGVRSIIITNRGSGYNSPPTVNISSSPSAGGNASGIATMIGGIVDICEPDSTLLRVQGVEIRNAGFGYTESPKISFVGGGGVGAEAISIISDGVVGEVQITNSGSGYTTPPNITFNSPQFGEAAKAVAVLSEGRVSEIRIIDGGFGYNTPPDMSQPIVTIDPPPPSGFGTFVRNELVIGSISGVTARVKSWDNPSRKLEVSNITGSFILGEKIIGKNSNSEYKIKSIDTQNSTDTFAQNSVIQQEADKIIDFSERNPFGTP